MKTTNKNMHRIVLLITMMLFFVLCLNFNFAANVNVDGSSVTINQGLNTANDGNTLLLAPGT